MTVESRVSKTRSMGCSRDKEEESDGIPATVLCHGWTLRELSALWAPCAITWDDAALFSLVFVDISTHRDTGWSCTPRSLHR